MWTNADQEKANGEGWRLVTTFNLGDPHPLWDIAVHTTRFSSDRDAFLAVVEAARCGSSIHQRALKLVADSRMRKTKGRK